MRRELVKQLSKMIRQRMSQEFPDIPQHPLTAEEKKLFIAASAMLFRKALGSRQWGLVCFEADPRDDNRLLVSAGWSYVDPLVYVKAGTDRFPIRTSDGPYPNPAGLWGIDSIQILAGGSVGLGWNLDIETKDFGGSCSDVLDEVMKMLHSVIPVLFERIAESKSAHPHAATI